MTGVLYPLSGSTVFVLNHIKLVIALDEFDIHPAKEADRKIVDWERTYSLTKYYMI